MMSNNQNRYSIAQVAVAFQVSSETIRLWCEEFERYLSPRANPGNRQKRNLTLEDIEVIALIAELKNEGMTFANIHAALDNGERGALPLSMSRYLSESDALVLHAPEQQLALQIKNLESEIEKLTDENERLTTELKATKELAELKERENLRYEVRVEILNEQADKLEKQIRELLVERAKLEREIGSMESDLRRKDDDK